MTQRYSTAQRNYEIVGLHGPAWLGEPERNPLKQASPRATLVAQSTRQELSRDPGVRGIVLAALLRAPQPKRLENTRGRYIAKLAKSLQQLCSGRIISRKI